MLLASFVAHYSRRRDLSPSSETHLAFAVRSLEAHAGRPLELSSLTCELIDGWIAARLSAGRSRILVHRQRGAVLTLWRAAHAAGLAAQLPEDVRMVRVRLDPPRAWQPDEFVLLLAAIDRLHGAFACGVPRRLFLRALALVGYYSGLRPSDLRRLRAADISTTGRLVVRVQKTGQVFDCLLPADALAAIAATQPERRELLFPISRKTLCAAWRSLIKAAGIAGTPKWLRRTGATRCEQQQPGSAMAYLGHRTPGLAHRHYVDSRQIASQRPVPPPLG